MQRPYCTDRMMARAAPEAKAAAMPVPRHPTAVAAAIHHKADRRQTETPMLTSRFKNWRNLFALPCFLVWFAGVSCFAARWSQSLP
jgi:hypothetical protein